MSDKLKPCPFCGSEDITIGYCLRGDKTREAYIECIECGASGYPYTKEKKAIDAWNRRAK